MKKALILGIVLFQTFLMLGFLIFGVVEKIRAERYQNEVTIITLMLKECQEGDINKK